MNTKLKAYKAKIFKLEGRALQVEELTQENSNLATKLATFREHINDAKVEVIAKF